MHRDIAPKIFYVAISRLKFSLYVASFEIHSVKGIFWQARNSQSVDWNLTTGQMNSPYYCSRQWSKPPEWHIWNSGLLWCQGWASANRFHWPLLISIALMFGAVATASRWCANGALYTSLGSLWFVFFLQPFQYKLMIHTNHKFPASVSCEVRNLWFVSVVIFNVNLWYTQTINFLWVGTD